MSIYVRCLQQDLKGGGKMKSDNLFKPKGFNLGLQLANAARTCPGKEALVDLEGGKRLTYRELNNRVNSVAHALSASGIKKGDYIAAVLLNCSEFIELYYATAKIGAVIAPLNYRLLGKEMVELINYSEAKTFVFSEGLAEIINTIKGTLAIEKYICVGGKIPSWATNYEDLAISPSAEEPDADINEHDPHKLEFTSGTTGVPKGYLLSHYMDAAASQVALSVFDFHHNMVDLIVFPLYGRVGMAHTIATICARGKIVLMNFDPGRVLETIEKERITVTNWVPTMAQMILQHPDLKKFDLSSLQDQGIIFAGSPLPGSILKGVWENITPNVYEYYGLQETGILVAVTPEIKAEKTGSCGAPVPILDVRIVDDEGNDVPTGEMGEVVASGPPITLGYHKEEEKTKEAFNAEKGWMHTGDIGRFDEDGYLYLEGRKKDIIITGAQNVFAPEVEAAIFSHAKVKDCTVIGLPDEKWGEKITAVIILKPGEKASEEEFIEYCKGKIAPFKVPKTVIFTDSIPRTPTGKAQKFILVDKYSPK
jgi:fatty-acyl-CoA synthase